MSVENPGRVRASDAEREETVAVLRDAMGEGRLTMSEGEERIAAAYAVTYRDELPALTADLPPVEPARTGRSGRERARPGPRRGSPVAGLVMLAAVVTGIWAVAAGGILWPAILLAVLALMLAKRGRHGHWQGGCGSRWAEAERERHAAGH